MMVSVPIIIALILSSVALGLGIAGLIYNFFG